MRNFSLVAGLIPLLLVSGCASGGNTSGPVQPPVVSPPSEPSSEPTVDLKVTTAVIFGTHVEFRNAMGVEVDRVSFESELTAFLSEAEKYLGPPLERQTQGPCTSVVYGDGYQVRGGDSLEVFSHSDSAAVQFRTESAQVNGIRIETPSGVSVGEDANGMVNSTAPELKGEMGTTLNGNPYWSLIYDPVGTWTRDMAQMPDGPQSVPYGAGAWVEDGLLTTIIFPSSVGTLYLSC